MLESMTGPSKVRRRRAETRETFSARLRGKFPAHDLERIMFAYDLSKAAHRGQTRKGPKKERYFEHPRALVLILLDELGIFDADLTCALLLHDSVEDSALFGVNHDVPHSERWRVARWRITRACGPAVASLVLALTKGSVDGHSFQTKSDVMHAYLRTLRRTAPKAVLGKMLDRLHNLRQMGTLPRAKQREQIRETRELLFPVFRRVEKAYPDAYVYLMGEMEKAMKERETRNAKR